MIDQGDLVKTQWKYKMTLKYLGALPEHPLKTNWSEGHGSQNNFLSTPFDPSEKTMVVFWKKDSGRQLRLITPQNVGEEMNPSLHHHQDLPSLMILIVLLTHLRLFLDFLDCLAWNTTRIARRSSTCCWRRKRKDRQCVAWAIMTAISITRTSTKTNPCEWRWWSVTKRWETTTTVQIPWFCACLRTNVTVTVRTVVLGKGAKVLTNEECARYLSPTSWKEKVKTKKMEKTIRRVDEQQRVEERVAESQNGHIMSAWRWDGVKCALHAKLEPMSVWHKCAVNQGKMCRVRCAVHTHPSVAADYYKL